MPRSPRQPRQSRSHRLSTLSLMAALALPFGFLPAVVTAASAQSATTGAIVGTVADVNGALLPSATVKVANAATGAERTVKANKSGEFRVPELQPGIYSVTVTADGFETFQQDLVSVTVGTLSNVTTKLVIGKVTDKVEVTDAPPELHTSSPEISTVIDQTQIDNLPINGRRYSDFALLTPGVVSNSDGFGLLSFRGISYLLNNTTVDGADDNQAYFSEARGRTRASYTVTQGSVQEFQVNTSNYSAEYGRAAGGVINTVTKSGSNKLRGELYFYDRDNGFGGAYNDYTQISTFNPTTGATLTPYKPKDWRKQMGGGVGGAIIKDKLFWFYAYDKSIRNFPGTARTSDPIDLLALATPLSGKEACATSNTTLVYGAPTYSYTTPAGVQLIQAQGVTSTINGYPIGSPALEGNAGACGLAAAFNIPYQAATAYYNQGLGVINTFFGPVPRTQNQDINFPKLDYQINDRNRLTLQYNRLREDSPNGVQTQTTNTYGRGSFGNDFVKVDAGIVRLSTILTNSIVNAALVQYGRDKEIETTSTPTPNEAAFDNVPAGEPAPYNNARPPDINIGYNYDSGGFDIGTSPIFSRAALPDERRLQLKDDVTWSHGKHTTKFGLDYNKVSDYINNLYDGYGSTSEDYAFSFIGDYLHATEGLGAGSAAYGTGNNGLYYSFSQGFGSAQGLLTTREYAGYATDDWRITPRLTLTLGVRYEYEYVPPSATPNPGINGTAMPFVANSYAHPDDRNNVGPRVGFAYNVFGDGKTTLRGGYGLYYGRIINSNILQAYQNSGGPNSQVNIGSNYPDSAYPTNALTTQLGIAGKLCAPAFGSIFQPLATTSDATLANLCSSAGRTISYIDPRLQNPQVHEVDLAVEQDLGHGFVLGVTYLGSFGRELDSSVDVNVTRGAGIVTPFVVSNPTISATNNSGYVIPHGGMPFPLVNGTTHYATVYTGNARQNQNYGNILRIASNVNSKYNALAFQLNKRLRGGLSLLSNFTWSHAMDFNPYIGTGVPTYNVLDPNDLSKEYGNSSLDVRQRFVFAAVYQPQTHFHGYKDVLAGGWRISPIVQAQTGLPFTPTITGYPAFTASGFRGVTGTGSSAARIDDIRRNQYHRPDDIAAALRVSKNFFFDVNHYGFERVRLELLGEVFNLANHQNITAINALAYTIPTSTNIALPTAAGFVAPQLVGNTQFGTNTNSNSNLTYSPRQVQVAARLHF